jgi:hypothetical protein
MKRNRHFASRQLLENQSRSCCIAHPGLPLVDEQGVTWEKRKSQLEHESATVCLKRQAGGVTSARSEAIEKLPKTSEQWSQATGSGSYSHTFAPQVWRGGAAKDCFLLVALPRSGRRTADRLIFCFILDGSTHSEHRMLFICNRR